jgi:hypothetical protein
MNDSKRKCDEPNPLEVAVDLSGRDKTISAFYLQ